MCGLRPTRQRVALLKLVMSGPQRHFTIDDLFDDARRAGCRVSLATAYNAARQFSASGLIRELSVDTVRSYYDTNTRHHHHYFYEDDELLVDAPAGVAEPTSLPAPPPGMSVQRVDVLIRLRRA